MPTGVTLPVASDATAGEVTACVDDTCTNVTLGTGTQSAFDFHGRQAVVSVNNAGNNVYVHFGFGSPAPPDGLVFRATVRDTAAGTTTTVKTDPVAWNVTELCGGYTCAAPKNLVVHPG